MTRSNRSTLLGGFVLCASSALGGCGPQYAFLESEDVAIEPVRQMSMRSGSLDEYGDVYVISMQSAHEVNGWVGAAIDGAAWVVQTLERVPASGREGDWELYGPYAGETDELSWLIRIRGDTMASEFEAWVGPAWAESSDDMHRALGGHVELEGSLRSGGFDLDFSVFETYPALKNGPDRDRTLAGRMEVQFERDTASDSKTVVLDFDEFSVTEEYPVPDYFAAEHYSFDRTADGSGTFHLSIVDTFQALLWSGPERERMILDMVWSPGGSGRARGQVLELEDEGDLAHGDVVIDECFRDDGLLTFREIGGAYAEAFPEYSGGDPAGCTFDDADLNP